MTCRSRAAHAPPPVRWLPALLVLAFASAPAAAQETVDGLSAACGDGDPMAEANCREIALTALGARAGLGLAAAGGSETPGSAGTLGWRLGSVPRISVATRLGGARVPFSRLEPALADPSPDAPASHDPFAAGLVQVGAGIGLFDGFSPVPTVGGLFALDLVGTGSLVFLPEERGFDGMEVTYGGGVRVGILRESFTLPGVSLSAVQRWSGEVPYRPDIEGATPRAAFETSATSLRATVGKDLVAVGLLLGAGWDRYAGTVRIDEEGGGAPTEWAASSDDLVDSRFLGFAGASMNFLVLQLSTEVGWANGIDAPVDRATGGFDPGAGSWFGNVAFRLTY